jgi:signal transduction histidine kinase/CheY-like chemotaxis protein/HPt (histidine-containing phosphotransfer) domain-containing protein
MPRARVALVSIFLATACLARSAWDTPSWGRPVIEVFRQQQTGIASAIYCAAAQPGDGPLWFGTGGSLLSFDGRNWQNFPEAKMVTACAFEPNGRRLWYGGWSDVGWFDISPDGQPQRVSLRDKLPFAVDELRVVRACFWTPAGTFFVADDRVLWWNGTKFDVWRYTTSLRLFPLRFEGQLWFHHVESGLYRLGDEGPVRVAEPAELPQPGLFWLGRENGELVGASNQGFSTISHEPRRLSPAALNSFLTQHRLIAVNDLGDGFRAVATLTGGVAIVDRRFQIVRHLAASDGLEGSLFGQLVGRENDLWLLCEDRLMRVDTTGASAQVRLDDNPQPHLIRAIAVAPDDSLWVEARNHVYHLAAGDHGFTSRELRPLPLKETRAIAVDGNRVWIGGFGAIALHENDRTKLLFELPSRSISLLARLGPDDRWIASLHDAWFEFSREPSGEWRTATHPNLPFLTAFARDPDGAIWTGSATSGPQKWRWSDHRFVPIKLPASLGKPESAPSLVAARRRDVLLMAGTKVYVARPESAPEEVCELPGPIAACALSPDERRLYVAFNRGPHAPVGYQDGVGLIELGDDGRSARWRSLQIPHLESIGAINKLAVSTLAAADTLWIGGSEGLLQTRPGEVPEWQPPAPPRITRVGVANAAAPLGFSETMHLHLDSPEIRLRPALRYQTQFGGDEPAWGAPSDQVSFEFPNLREGRYSFAARAVNPLGQTSAPAYFPFTVPPPWYRSGWAYAGYAAVAGLSLLGGLRYRERRMRARTLELERLVRERTTELEKANAAKDEFLASMSHEIRNPMNGVVGLSAAIDTSFLDEEGRYRFGLLRHCASHLASLLEDILDFSKLQAGTIELDPQPFSPMELLEAVSAITAPMSAAAGVRVEFALGPTVPPRLIGDARRIRQVLLNYVSNAVKYAPRGTIEVTAWARALEGDRVALTFAVSDEGPGIPAAEQKRIFEKFERGAGVRSSHIPGTGMGLAVCRRLAEKMGGSAWVESTPGLGSTFCLELSLPIATDASVDLPAPRALHALLKRALVVDDEEYNVVSLAAMLERHGFTVQRALDASAALRAAVADPPDVVFLDYDMPDTTGPQLARRLRETLGPLGQHPLVIATTAYTTVEKRAECFAAGMDGFLGKPVAEERLQATLDEALRRRHPAVAPPLPFPDKKGFDSLGNLHTLAQQHARTLESELAAFNADAEAEFGALIAAFASGDPEGSARAAHKIAGRFGFLQAAAPMRRSLQLEQLCRASEWSAARPLAEEIAQDWAALRESLARLTGAPAE